MDVAPSAALDADPMLSTSDPETFAHVLMRCFAADRERWMAAALPEPVVYQMWGDLGWIRTVTNPAQRELYTTVFDLSAGQYTVAAQKLLAATNRMAGSNTHAKARQIEGWMNEQYSADIPESSDEFDPEFRDALQASAMQMDAMEPHIARASDRMKPYVRLLLEGTIYNDEFAQTCGAAQIADALAGDQAVVAAAQATLKTTLGASQP